MAMTDEQRLAKNASIKEAMKATHEKRKSQVCRVYMLKVQKNSLSARQKEDFRMLFLEAKWLYNDNLDTAGHVTAASIQQTGTGFGTVSGNDLTGGPGITVKPYGFGKDVVPEPTGGLLMLVGGALLALRRMRSV